jgi:hypothetical protein
MKSEQNPRASGADAGPSPVAAPHAPVLYDRDSGLDEDVIDVVAVVMAIVLVTLIALAC